MEILITIIYTAFFSYLIFKLKFFKIDGFPTKFMIIAFILKILGGLALIYVYTIYYKTRVNADIFKYFDDGKIIFSAFKNHNFSDYFKMITGIGGDSEHLKQYYENCGFWYKHFNYNLYNDNRTVIRFNAIAMLFSGGYLWVHTVFMSFLSFIGLTSIFKIFIKFLENKKYLLFLGIYFAPSVILWTSGVIKEGLLIFAFGQMLYHIIKILEKGIKNFSIFWLLLSIFILLISKFYVLVAAIPGIISVIWIYKTNFRRIYLKFTISYLIFLLIGFNTGKITDKYNATEIIATKQHDFYNFLDTIKNVGSRYEIPRLKPTAISIIKNSPEALINAFIQPSPKRINSIMMIPAAIENYLLILLLLLAVIFGNYKKIQNKTLFLFSVLFVFNLYIITGLTTPVIGALVRYKAPAIPFLIIVILFLIDFKNLHINFLKFNPKNSRLKN